MQAVRTRPGPRSRLIPGQLRPAGQRAFSFHSTCMVLNYIRCNERRIATGRGCRQTRRRSTWGARHGVGPAATSLNTPQEKPHHCRGPGPPRELGFCANQQVTCPKRPHRLKARPFSAGTGARFEVDPERPSWPQSFAEGQNAPGIHRVVRRPFAVLRNTLPQHIPAGMSAMPSTSEPSLTTGKPIVVNTWSCIQRL